MLSRVVPLNIAKQMLWWIEPFHGRFEYTPARLANYTRQFLFLYSVCRVSVRTYGQCGPNLSEAWEYSFHILEASTLSVNSASL